MNSKNRKCPEISFSAQLNHLGKDAPDVAQIGGLMRLRAVQDAGWVENAESERAEHGQQDPTYRVQ